MTHLATRATRRRAAWARLAGLAAAAALALVPAAAAAPYDTSPIDVDAIAAEVAATHGPPPAGAAEGAIDPGEIAARTRVELGGDPGDGAPRTRPPGTDGRPMTIIYDTSASVQRLTVRAPGRAVTGARGAFRQDPGPGGLHGADGRDPEYRIAKVSASELLRLTPEGMAARLRREIDSARHGARSHVVAIDEIGNPFNDRRGSAGARLSRAMRILGAPSPHGGTYAERVHLYIAPAMASAIGVGRGPHRNLGRDGRPHRPTWRGVMPALAAAGGVWLEMYHYRARRGVHPMSAELWRVLPARFASYHRRFGGRVDRLHLVFAGVGERPAGTSPSCGAPMACQWRLATRTPIGLRILRNGPGAYRLGPHAAAWLAGFNRHMP